MVPPAKQRGDNTDGPARLEKGRTYFGIRRHFPATTEEAPGTTPGPTRASRADARRRPDEPRFDCLCLIVYTLAMGLGIGAGAMVARRVGEKDLEGAARTGAQAIGFGLLVAAAVSVAGAAYAPRLLALMGAPAGALAHASFARILLGGSASVVLLFLANSV
ncbi:MAG TPA: MATE family efflux transporter [Polyangiaceae bacterium]|nr:MATE family efflux transporter [Polyangiaceae bacterium]